MPSHTDTILREIAHAIDEARSIAVVTGAGVSAESDIPTFRDTMTGLWAEFDPQTLATPQAFARDPELVTRWYDHRRLGCLAAEPNPGHHALARIEQRVCARGGDFVLLTQNVDGLHRRAGSERIVELHGSVHTWRCTKTGKQTTLPPEALEQFPPPSPFAEGARLRPGVVWFGEALPAEAIDRAERAAAECDLFFSIGTSAVVYPAAGFIQVASARGARTCEINADDTPISSELTWSVRGRSGEVLPRIVELLER